MPTLTIGAVHDTMDPVYMERMARVVRHGRYHRCPNGSHTAMFDDQPTYFAGLVKFLKDRSGDLTADQRRWERRAGRT